MSAIEQLRVELGNRIASAGLAVTLDPRDVQPPCVLVGAPTVIDTVGPGAMNVTIPVHVLMTTPANGDGLEWGLCAVETCLVVLRPMSARRATPDEFNSGGLTLPSYVIEVTRSLSLEC